VAAVPFKHLPLPHLPLVVPKSDYSVFTPDKGAMWPCVGMHCPATPGKNWVLLVNQPVTSSPSSSTPSWLDGYPTSDLPGLDEDLSLLDREKSAYPENSDSSASVKAEGDKSSKEKAKEPARNLVWALYVEPLPEEHKGTQPFGNLFQFPPLDTDQYIVTYMRRAYVCPQTGDLEIARMEPSNDKYGVKLVWPERPKDFASTFSSEAIVSSEIDPNIVDSSSTATSIISGGSSVDSEKLSPSFSSSSSSPSTPSTQNDYIDESQLAWKSEPRLQAALEGIRNVLKDASESSPAVELVLHSVNWSASTVYDVNEAVDRVVWLLNDVPNIGEQFSRLLPMDDVLWRARSLLILLKSRFVADRYGYTSMERRKHMESFLSGLNESPARTEARLFIEKYRRAALELPENVRQEVLHQISRLSPLGSPELSTSKRVLDFILELPWNTSSKDTFDMQKAREILDKNHYGMEEVKRRVLELLAVNQLTGKFAKGKVLALIGPPGTGKTTIASSIASSLGRSFGQIAIGGLWDISDLKGHRRTYLASMAGQLLRTLNSCKTNNPVILLDEIDKLTPGSQVSTALLEILDPSQQSTFTDVWIDLPFDISNVLFVCTANWEEAIHPALRDRLEVVTLEGYLEDEKVEIAKRHLLPKCMKNAGLTDKQFSMTDAAIRALVKHYSPMQPGVRDLETQLQAIVNACSLNIARNKDPDANTTYHLNQNTYEQYLPRSEFHKYEHEQTPVNPGCATALTQLGVQQIEALAFAPTESTHGSYKITGNLDEVMKESTQLAYTYLTNALRSCAPHKDESSGVAHDGEANNKKKSAGHSGEASENSKESGEISRNLAKVPKRFSSPSSSTGSSNVQSPSGNASAPTHQQPSHQHQPQLPFDPEFFGSRSVHIHLPKGGQVKGGVHAGTSIALALLSLALNRPVPQGWAVSGELTLLGRVLPITHLKRMVHAAQLHKLKKLILPEDNRQHWEELPEALKKGIAVHFVSYFHDIAALVFKVHLPKPLTNNTTSSNSQKNKQQEPIVKPTSTHSESRERKGGKDNTTTSSSPSRPSTSPTSTTTSSASTSTSRQASAVRAKRVIESNASKSL